MKKDVTIKEIEAVIEASTWLKICSQWLWKARVTGSDRAAVSVFEWHVGQALDRLWEAQQRAS